MSILIKGAEMPKGDGGLVLVIFKDGTVYSPGVLTKSLVREKNAEAITIPTPHGRLIDAEAFAKTMKDVSIRQGYSTLKIDKDLTVDDVFDSVIAEMTTPGLYGCNCAPTVIEAEE